MFPFYQHGQFVCTPFVYLLVHAGPILFLLDLQHSHKFAKSSHFTDDTCLTYSNKNAKTLETNLNHDLKNLTQWLSANRLSLNVDKTRLFIFKSKYNKNQYDDIIIKLLGSDSTLLHQSNTLAFTLIIIYLGIVILKK